LRIKVLYVNIKIQGRCGLMNSKILKNIEKIFCQSLKQNINLYYIFNKLDNFFYNFCTSFPQKLWKTQKTLFFLTTCIVLLTMFSLYGCSASKKSTKAEKIQLEQILLSMDEKQVREKLGEPTAISRTTENNILWTYQPSWRIIPYNKDAVYIEFEKGKVIRVYKVR